MSWQTVTTSRLAGFPPASVRLQRTLDVTIKLLHQTPLGRKINITNSTSAAPPHCAVPPWRQEKNKNRQRTESSFSPLGYMLIPEIWLLSDLDVRSESEADKGERRITDNLRTRRGEIETRYGL